MKTTKKITIEQAIKAGNNVTNQTIKQKFVAQNIYCNVGSFVEYCLSKGFEDSESPVSLDNIENYYSYPEYNGKYARFEGGTDEQRLQEIERLESLMSDSNYDEKTHTEPLTESEEQEIQNELEALENLESEPQEILEWWAVSDFLFDKLKESGCCVVDAGSCYVWGRTTSGQAILLYYVITKICAEMEILEGQTHSWA